MIKNEYQFHITKTQRDKFAQALDQLFTEENHQSNIHPLLIKAQKDALTSQLIELNKQIKEYKNSN